jgi:peptidoglycan/LPS O-acetylase OafA/YrhL
MSSAPIQKARIFFPNLDGLRFLSFLLVFFSHSFAADNAAIKQMTWYKIVKVRMFSDGDIGVSFFFVLSGFLITYLLIKEKEFTGSIHIKSFYIRRALRIWPLYYFAVLFGFLVFPMLKTFFGQVPNETANPILCSLFLNNFDRIYNGAPDASVLAVLWSVAIEEQFYLIWPLLLFATPEKYYKHVILAVIAVSSLYRFIFYKPLFMENHTLSVIVDMAIGGLGAYFCITSKKFLHWIENMPRWVIAIPYLLAIVYIGFRYQIFASPEMARMKRVIMASTFIFIILEQNFAKHSFFKIGNFKIITWLGKYTYGLYCLHGIAILVSVTLLRKFSLNEYSWQIWFLELPISLGLSIIISWLSFTYFESWFLKLKNKFAFITK